MANNKILIVEDDPNLLTTLKYNLQKDVYDVVTAVDGAEAVDVGKRGQKYSVGRQQLLQMLQDCARQGQRVVRLKGGDPGIFGRLADEVAALDSLGLPFRVIPGVSSLTAASSGTGFTLTRRGVARGFTVITPRKAETGLAPIDAETRRGLPIAVFMAVARLDETQRRTRRVA